MRKRLVIANWKGYIESPEAAAAFAGALRRKARAFAGVEVWLAPPHPFISVVAGALTSSAALQVGGQALSALEGPQHTGEVSGTMLRSAGASFVLVGHSERRALGETNEHVAVQLAHALASSLAPVLCVGEQERDPTGAYFALIERQLSSGLARLTKSNVHKKLVVAYEPVWAIGKSAEDAMKPADVQEMTIFIRKTLAEILGRKAALRVPILYGGSVEPGNAEALLDEGGVSGFLVGHASAQEEPFFDILKLCKK